MVNALKWQKEKSSLAESQSTMSQTPGTILLQIEISPTAIDRHELFTEHARNSFSIDPKENEDATPFEDVLSDHIPIGVQFLLIGVPNVFQLLDDYRFGWVATHRFLKCVQRAMTIEPFQTAAPQIFPGLSTPKSKTFEVVSISTFIVDGLDWMLLEHQVDFMAKRSPVWTVWLKDLLFGSTTSIDLRSFF